MPIQHNILDHFGAPLDSLPNTAGDAHNLPCPVLDGRNPVQRAVNARSIILRKIRTMIHDPVEFFSTDCLGRERHVDTSTRAIARARPCKRPATKVQHDLHDILLGDTRLGDSPDQPIRQHGQEFPHLHASVVVPCRRPRRLASRDASLWLQGPHLSRISRTYSRTIHRWRHMVGKRQEETKNCEVHTHKAASQPARQPGRPDTHPWSAWKIGSPRLIMTRRSS